MKTIIRSNQSINHAWFKALLVLLICITFLIFPSCQKEEEYLPVTEQESLKCLIIPENPVGDLYYGHTIFTRTSGAPIVETQTIENPNFHCFDGNFILKIKNGYDKRTRVSSAEIRIDGRLIVGPRDFSKNKFFISKQLTGLTPESVLEVKLNSAPGSFIDLWIEGTLISISPTFTQIGPLLQKKDAPALPDTSDNGIAGTWNPETISTATAGNFTFTFTPDPDQCATTATMIINIINIAEVADVEGNIYKTMLIGDQWWMTENLKTTKYNNGDLIGTTTPATLDISGENQPKYQWAYNGNEDNVNAYGRYYTWYAVNDSRGICPSGWHIPTDADLTSLTDYLINNGYGFEGSGTDIAKSLASESGWQTNATQGNIGNDQASNNSSGFTALPGGERIANGTFNNTGIYASFWSSTSHESIATKAWSRSLYYNLNYMVRSDNKKKYGDNIRCIKD